MIGKRRIQRLRRQSQFGNHVFMAALFMATTLAGLLLALSLYGGAKAARLALTSGQTFFHALKATAVMQIEPAKLPSPLAATMSFALLSMSGLSAYHAAQAQTASPPALSHHTVAWSSVVNTLTQKVSAPHRLTVGWTLDTGAANLEATLANTPGLTVLAPKWLHVDGLNGAIAGQIEPGVVKKAKQMGVQVWAVVDNGFNGSLSHQILRYRDQQNKLIAHIVQIAVDSGINGINLDFEGLFPADRWNYSRFVMFLAQALHKHHLALSVDLPPDVAFGNNSGPYNHAALAQAANYIVLMGYDEYWGGEQTPGPTSSLPWVQGSVKDMIQTGVPARKLILGLPFYTQNWTLSPSGSVVGSTALSLFQTRSLLAQQKAKISWNRSLGLHVATFAQGGFTHEIWIEDRRSLLLSADIVAEDHLAGAAAWYLGLEPASIWSSLVNAVHSAVA